MKKIFPFLLCASVSLWLTVFCAFAQTVNIFVNEQDFTGASNNIPFSIQSYFQSQIQGGSFLLQPQPIPVTPSGGTGYVTLTPGIYDMTFQGIDADVSLLVTNTGSTNLINMTNFVLHGIERFNFTNLNATINYYQTNITTNGVSLLQTNGIALYTNGAGAIIISNTVTTATDPGALHAANNLSDVATPATALANLGGINAGYALNFSTNSTNFSLFIGQAATNIANAVGQSVSNLAGTLSANSTNFSLLIGQAATNIANMVGLSLTNLTLNLSTNSTNFSLSLSTNATNFSLLIGQAATNIANMVGLSLTNLTLNLSTNSTNFSLSLSTNATNFSLLIGQAATNIANAVGLSLSNLALNLSTNATNYAQSLAPGSTNFALTLSTNGTNFSLGLSTNATNYSLLIGAAATNIANAVGLSLSNLTQTLSTNATNFSLTLSANATNYSLLIGTAATNIANAVGLSLSNLTQTLSTNATNFSLALSTNSTNFSLLIGQAATNIANAMGLSLSNLTQTFSTNATNFSLSLSTNATNYANSLSANAAQLTGHNIFTALDDFSAGGVVVSNILDTYGDILLNINSPLSSTAATLTLFNPFNPANNLTLTITALQYAGNLFVAGGGTFGGVINGNGAGVTNVIINQTNLISSAAAYTNFTTTNVNWGTNMGRILYGFYVANGIAVYQVSVNPNLQYVFYSGTNAWETNNATSQGGSQLSDYNGQNGAPYKITNGQIFYPDSNILYLTSYLTNTGAVSAQLYLAGNYAGKFKGDGSLITSLTAANLTGPLPTSTLPANATMTTLATTNSSTGTASFTINYGPGITVNPFQIMMGGTGIFWVDTNGAFNLPPLTSFYWGGGQGYIYFDTNLVTHPAGGEFIFVSNGDLAFGVGYNGWGLSHVQFGGSGAWHDGWYFQYDDAPSASYLTGYSKVIGFHGRYWNGAAQIESSLEPGMQALVVNTNGGGPMMLGLYNPAPVSVGGVGAANAPTGGVLQIGALTNGAIMNGLEINSLYTLTPATTNVLLDFNGISKKNILNLSQAANFVLTNVATLTNKQYETLQYDIYPGTSSYGLTFPTNFIWFTNDVYAANPTSIPASQVMRVVLDVAVGSGITNYTAIYSLASYMPTLDTNAVNFFNQVINNGGSLTSVESNAVNSLVLNLKAGSLWTNVDALYPMVGGTSNSMAVNLVNTNKYKITWHSQASGDFTTNGFTGDGSSKYGDTGFNPFSASSPVYTTNSGSMAVYTKATSPTSGGAFIGADDSNAYAGLSYSSGLSLSGFNAYQGSAGTFTYTAGYQMGTRTSSTTLYLTSGTGGYYSPESNGGTLGVPHQNVYVDATYNGGAANYCNANLSFIWIGGGLSSSQSATLSSIIATFETALSRQ